MLPDINVKEFCVDGSKPFKLRDRPTSVPTLYKDKKHYKKLQRLYQKQINELQNKMYAHDKYGVLLLFQAMDAAGKDSTIQHVMSGINPHGVKVFAFKKPSENEIDRGFLWRTNQHMPARGTVHIFNRSYYEEVLIVKVHDHIVHEHQKLPEYVLKDEEKLWEDRYAAIRAMERYEHNNGIRVIKFFLNLSKEEQKNRFLARIDTPEKNWKFSSADIKERGHWGDYMDAYEDAINETATKQCPWYVVPADDKKTMRLIVSQIILENLQDLKIDYPELDKDERERLSEAKRLLLSE